jgi:hypothetical protein
LFKEKGKGKFELDHLKSNEIKMKKTFTSRKMKKRCSEKVKIEKWKKDRKNEKKTEKENGKKKI